jgi:hypothetical protein
MKQLIPLIGTVSPVQAPIDILLLIGKTKRGLLYSYSHGK